MVNRQTHAEGQQYSQKGLSKCKWTTRHFIAIELFMGHSNF